MTTTETEQFSAEEAAMNERARELKAQAKGADGESAALVKIAEMPAEEQVLATGFHEVVWAVVTAWDATLHQALEALLRRAAR